ncbi:MAG: FtsX-like permease family protein [Phycisphaeraceae bacterium]|nr:FtsX-like permease family protein [Phycisphaeraceae bacterium]MCW5753139.1 FtsX-like permease family protein [Phycisphaeraceae bacterium]
MPMTDFTIVRRSLNARLFSTVTTALTVGVAVALLFVLLTLRDSAKSAFSRGSGNMHLLVSAEASELESVLHSVFYTGAPQAFFPYRFVDELDEILGEADAPAQFIIPTQVGDSFRGMPVVATTEDFFTEFQPFEGQPWVAASGRWFEKPFEVVLGAEVARTSGLRVGQMIYLTHGMSRRAGAGNDIATDDDHHHDHDHDHDHDDAHIHREYRFEIVGILAATGTSHDRALFTHLIGSWIMHAHDRRLAELGHGIELTTEADLTEADRIITAAMVRIAGRAGRATAVNVPAAAVTIRRSGLGLRVAAPGDEVRKLFRIVSNLDQIFIALAGAILISSGIGILLALYNSMEQRRRQIAVLRVLGSSRSRIFGLIMTESAVIGMLGAAAGLAIGLVGSQLATGILRDRLGLDIRPEISPEWLLVLAAATTLLATLAGLIPAIMAYRTSVARNLRPIA